VIRFRSLDVGIADRDQFSSAGSQETGDVLVAGLVAQPDEACSIWTSVPHFPRHSFIALLPFRPLKTPELVASAPALTLEWGKAPGASTRFRVQPEQVASALLGTVHTASRSHPARPNMVAALCGSRSLA
jgi:hypothetical protein